MKQALKRSDICRHEPRKHFVSVKSKANGAPKGYLVGTDPRFTQSKQWLGSDYMLTQMGFHPATQTKRVWQRLQPAS